ncbi:hypothetical protein GGQ92_000707 [Gracilibacillus halotolerans]|uniref:Ribosomal processing cysteine protease Prp n=1 Tax=Gracilibacillus halotolerans TaxID=74386 RepID=A0A841RD97_9BACI|nr:ribosomal-processing cysteine protease Prp [Gracilibacillus halotolerans]MBB6511940.1 hypothetical protein [Gracilibacillus halotolerans]
MIRVKIKRDNGQIKSFQLKGHAESGPVGHDLVCAAVSGITFGAVNAVLELCNVPLEIDQAGSEGGFLKVTIEDMQPSPDLEKACLLFEGMLISLQTVEHDYSKHISIIDK